jgi:hypothetical protein
LQVGKRSGAARFGGRPETNGQYHQLPPKKVDLVTDLDTRVGRLGCVVALSHCWRSLYLFDTAAAGQIRQVIEQAQSVKDLMICRTHFAGGTPLQCHELTYYPDSPVAGMRGSGTPLPEGRHA